MLEGILNDAPAQPPETAEDDAAVERVTKRFEAKLKIIRKARDDRNDHGPALVLEKLVERIDALIEKLRD